MVWFAPVLLGADFLTAALCPPWEKSPTSSPQQVSPREDQGSCHSLAGEDGALCPRAPKTTPTLGTSALGGRSRSKRRSRGGSLPAEEELRKLREETNSEMLRQELDRERQRRMELEQKVQEVLKAR